MSIHPTAFIEPGADIHESVQIGPHCVIGAQVSMAAGCVLHSHVVIKGITEMGENNEVYPFTVLGESPQDLKYKGEETKLKIGQNNIFRESVTVHRGTVQDRGETTIGDSGLFMAYVHIAHDSVIGSDVIFANYSGVAGHCAVGRRVIFGAGALVHQHCQVGEQSFLSMGTIVLKDVPAYVTVRGNPCRVYGLNIEGMRRRGVDASTRTTLRKAYHILYNSGHTAEVACHKLAQLAEDCEEVEVLIESVQQSQRGIVRPDSQPETSS